MAPDNLYLSYNLAFAYFKLGHLEKALKQFQNTIQLDRKNVLSWFHVGLIYEQKEEFDNAIKHYKEFLEMDPKYKDAWEHLGRIYRKKNEYSKADMCFEKLEISK